ncbi:putative ATP-dependent RNA helicase TDRD12 isoform X2 [Orussus abietinus]|uniref:putative ATP-dependent RNA helicase TDRD12 isoform X2 n=1 Tax=Orussus abietinus TaxID=222816 RepID=UPI0006267457|nr:putative ATP-dependent RNA helicase TDRD12 isoform X2 [Orussus abietinus]
MEIKITSMKKGKCTHFPATAIQVQVTNIVTPYFIRIYNGETYSSRLSKVNRELQRRVQKEVLKNDESIMPQIQDSVVVHMFDKKIDIPSWWCRGIVGSLNTATSKYNVFLPDYGNAIELSRKDFSIVPKNFFNDIDYLTFTIGLYNIIPAGVDSMDNSKQNQSVTIFEDWSAAAIQFTKELLIAAQQIYFEVLATENNRKFGDLYLIMEDEILSLRETLVYNQFAVYLDSELVESIENPAINGGMANGDINSCTTSNGRELVNGEKQSLHEGTDDEVPTSGEEASNKFLVAQTLKKIVHSTLVAADDPQETLVCSKTKCKYLCEIADAKFTTGIHQGLKMLEFEKPLSIQSYVWPAIMSGLDVVAIGPPKSGKTMAYVAPVASTITTYKLAKMYNGCQILISTPPFLTRFMNKYKKILNIDGLTHLILDGADMMFDKYFQSLAELFSKHRVICNRDRQDLSTPLLQIITVAREWTPFVKKFVMTSMDNPYVCIRSYMEAAVYGCVRATLHCMVSQGKNEKTLELLQKSESNLKTMIICANYDEAVDVNAFLTSQSKKTLLVHEKTVLTEMQGVRSYWMASVWGEYPILICTDEVLSELKITDVEWLIHYSVNVKTKTMFYNRFKCLMNNWKMKNNNCKVTIMVDETNNKEFYGVVNTVQRLGAKISQNLRQAVKRISVTLDREKKHYPICDKVKALGYCPKKHSCIYRHCVLREVDMPMTDIKIGDNVQLLVTYIHDATHYSARIIKYTNPDTNKITAFPADEYARFHIKMQEYYSVFDNKKKKRGVSVGDICVMEEMMDRYKRVQILHIVESTIRDDLNIVRVRCIDDGMIFQKRMAYELLEIPDELLKWPVHIVEVFLAGISPFDSETDWNRCVDDAVHQWFDTFLDKESYVCGKVCLHLGNTLWMESLEIRSSLIGCNDFFNSSLKTELINTKHGVKNGDHMKYLLELCKADGLTWINDHVIEEGDTMPD